jgi:hypothetical protein
MALTPGDIHCGASRHGLKLVMEARGRSWAEDWIDKAKVGAIWAVDPEMVQCMSNVIPSFVVCAEPHVQQQLRAITR